MPDWLEFDVGLLVQEGCMPISSVEVGRVRSAYVAVYF